MGGLKTQEDLQECFTTHYKGHWDKRHGSVSVTALKSAFFFGKAVGTVRTTSKVGKKLNFIESNNSVAAGSCIPPDYTPKRNYLCCISSVERVVVEVKDAVETNMEMSKDKLVEVMDGVDKLN